MTRRGIAVVLVLATGCGVSPHRPRFPAATTAAPTISLAHARDLVHVGTVSAADLPGWKRETGSPSPDDSSISDVDFRACIGQLGRQEPILEGNEADFSKGSAGISSGVTVAATPALATLDTAIQVGPRVNDCLKRDLAHTLSYEGVVIDTYKSTPSRTTVGGVRVDALTVTVTLSNGQQSSPPIVLRFLACAVGHAELYVAGFGLKSAPAMASLVNLLGKAVARVKKAKP